MFPLQPEIWFPIFLYAETHYKFKGIYSRLYKREPEILADAPYRIEPGQPIPILLLIKDAHWFPLLLESVAVNLTAGKQTKTQEFLFNLKLDHERYWHRVVNIFPSEQMAGWISVEVIFKIKINGQTKSYTNDNYNISSHAPLHVWLADEMLPRFDNWYFGDLHYHSNFTEDMVEFGAPLAATVEMARSVGLHFFAVTDHSYDLDDCEDDWLTNDPEIPKWYRMLEEVNRLNQTEKNFVVLPGEEVSAGNSRGKNVHLLIINSKKFFKGKGDGAERWLRSKPDLSISQILSQLEDDALAIAGHPEMKVPFLQRLLIRRGRWLEPDFAPTNLHGFQIWNGERDAIFRFGSRTWVKLLLAGKKLSLLAGNDAHGNFNRFRQIGFPFFTFRESSSQIFGQMRTGVRLTSGLTVANLVTEIKQGRTLVSNGPVAELVAFAEDEKMACSGDHIAGKRLKINLKAKSSVEFGKLSALRLLVGDFSAQAEYLILNQQNISTPYFTELSIHLPEEHSDGYLRAEIEAMMPSGEVKKCLTNPIWFTRKGRTPD